MEPTWLGRAREVGRMRDLDDLAFGSRARTRSRQTELFHQGRRVLDPLVLVVVVEHDVGLLDGRRDLFDLACQLAEFQVGVVVVESVRRYRRTFDVPGFLIPAMQPDDGQTLIRVAHTCGIDWLGMFCGSATMT